MRSWVDRGVLCAAAAGVLFGASTPAAKLLVGGVGPVLLAGLLYLGSGVGLGIWWLGRRWVDRTGERAEAAFSRADWGWLAGAVVCGGIVAPVLLMWGLVHTAGSTASLLLNMEVVFTALVAGLVFRENIGLRLAAGLAAIVAGGAVLSWAGMPSAEGFWGAAAVAGACLGWGVDNNLTKRIVGGSAVRIAALKGLVAGGVNVGLAFGVVGAVVPAWRAVVSGGAVGLVGYGVSLVLFVMALRRIGAARSGAYFAVAPFVGAAVSVPLLGERPTAGLLGAAALMAAGVYLYLTERHEHVHVHEEMVHSHEHVHDEHHRHEHEGPVTEPHVHVHQHEAMRHSHAHFPDVHHPHPH